MVSEMNGWRRCSNWNHNVRDLPPTGKLLLVNVHTSVGDDVRTAMIGRRVGGELFWDIEGYGFQKLNEDHVTHWMPLPSPPHVMEPGNFPGRLPK